MKFTCANIVSEISKQHWGQVYHQDNVFLVIETKSSAEEAILKGRELLDKLIKLTESEEVNGLVAFKKSMDKLFEELADSFSSAVIAAKVIGNVIYIIVRVRNESLPINQADQLVSAGGVYLVREKTLSRVCQSPANISGKLKAGDRLYFFSPTLAREIDISHLDTREDFDIQKTAEELAVFLHQAGTKGAAGMIVKVEDVDEGQEAQMKVESAPVRETTKPFLSTLGQRIVTLFTFGRKISTRLRGRFANISVTKRKWLSILFFLVLLFFVSIFFGIKKRQDLQRISKWQQVKESVVNNIEEAQALVEVNNRQARELLKQARSQLESLSAEISDKSAEGKEIAQLLAKIAKVEEIASQKYVLNEANEFFDLTLIKPAAKGVQMSVYKETLAVLDRENRVVYSINLAKKSSTIAAGGDLLSDALLVAIYGERIFVLTGKGVMMSEKGGKPEMVLSVEDEKWGKIADMASFAGNIYLVDADSSEILKYPATDEGLGAKTIWLPDSNIHQFNSSSRLAIDGSIWTITGSRVQRFMQGVPQSFELSGLDEELSSDTDIFTDDESENLYILDKGNSRIVVFDKEGNYQSQYIWTGIGQVTDMVAWEKEGKILLLDQNLIYEVDLQQKS